jgi:hypothetical protein
MNPTRGVLSNITNIPAVAASIIAAAATTARRGAIDNSSLTGLPSPLKEMRQMTNQAQVDKTNTQKNKDGYNLALLGLLNLLPRRGRRERGRSSRQHRRSSTRRRGNLEHMTSH